MPPFSVSRTQDTQGEMRSRRAPSSFTTRHLRLVFLAWCFAVLTACGALSPGQSVAQACPNCKAANETDPLKPKAYMYSILFMIAMPATIFTGFSFSFWRMTRNARLQSEAESVGDIIDT